MAPVRALSALAVLGALSGANAVICAWPAPPLACTTDAGLAVVAELRRTRGLPRRGAGAGAHSAARARARWVSAILGCARRLRTQPLRAIALAALRVGPGPRARARSAIGSLQQAHAHVGPAPRVRTASPVGRN